jgi:TRAP-type C4-dicarboxylate transport system permease small subunit
MMLVKLTNSLLKIERLFVAIAGLALVMMVLIVVYDIIGRTVGGWNLLSAIEQTTLYMMLLGFLGLSRCFRDEGHIVVDLVTSGLSKSTICKIDAIWAIVTALVLFPLGYLVIKDGIVLDAYGRRSEILGISPLVHHAIAGVGFGMAGLVALLIGLRNLLIPSDFEQPQTLENTDPHHAVPPSK